MTSFLSSVLLTTGLALGAMGSSQAQQPLLQDGKQTLYQRVLTTPGCHLHTAPNQGIGEEMPAFSRFYIYAKQNDWIQVGPDSFGQTSGWLRENCTVEWKMQLSLAFTNPANRDRLLFFKDRDTLESILDAPDPAHTVAPLRAQLARHNQADEVLAQEPEYFVDLEKEFYLLPILEGEEVMSDSGFRSRLLKVASVSQRNEQTDEDNDETDTSSSHQIQAFNAAVMFLIDSTISMDPYIARTKEAVCKIYEQVEAENLTDQVQFGLASYRNSIEATPKVEYLTRVFARPNEVSSGAEFLEKVKDLKQATASTASWNEDTYAGMMEAIHAVPWRDYGARYIVLITDSAALDPDSPLSSTKLEAQQVREEARKRGIAVYTLHLKTPEGKHDHAKAEGQYSNLSLYTPTGDTLYYPVNAGDVNEFGRMVDRLAQAITNQVKSAYMGEDAIGSANYSENASSDSDEQLNTLTAQSHTIGHAMRLAYLGSQTGTQAPNVFEAWISDRDLIQQHIPTTDVRVLLTKAQLSDLRDILQQVMVAANEGLISPSDMFSQLRSIAATMSNDPSQTFAEDNTKLSELGIMGEYLEDLPYQSEVLSLDEDTWVNWDALTQEKFIRTIHTKLNHYRKYNADTDHWVKLAPDSDARDEVYPVPLEMMP